MKTRMRSLSGLTLIEAMIVVAILAVLVAMLLPALGRARSKSKRINCTNSLRSIGLSFRQWAADNDDKFPMQVTITNGGAMEWARAGLAWRVFQVMSNEINTPKILVCSADSDGRRVIATTFGTANPNASWPPISFTNNQNVSYFAGLDSSRSQTNLLLVGDSHFEVGGKALASGLQELSSERAVGWTAARHHKRTGNLGFTDGSVRPFTSQELPVVFKTAGLATNRLVLP